MKELKLETLSNFLSSEGLYHELFKVNIIKQAVEQAAPAAAQGQQSAFQFTDQKSKAAAINLDEAVNAFSNLLTNIAGSPEKAEKLLARVQKMTSGPLFNALMKAVSADYNEIDRLLKQGQVLDPLLDTAQTVGKAVGKGAKAVGKKVRQGVGKAKKKMNEGLQKTEKGRAKRQDSRKGRQQKRQQQQAAPQQQAAASPKTQTSALPEQQQAAPRQPGRAGKQQQAAPQQQQQAAPQQQQGQQEESPAVRGLTAKILANAPQFQSLGESVMTAAQQLEAAMRPEGDTSDYLEQASTQKALVNDAINRNQTLSQNAKSTIKALIMRFVG